jgi:hypothetical protein
VTFPVNNLTVIKINGDPPIRWAEFEVDDSDDPETVADVRAALEDCGHAPGRRCGLCRI